MKRPGRPPLDPHDPSVQVSVTITTRQYDALYRQARDARISLAEALRRSITVQKLPERLPRRAP